MPTLQKKTSDLLKQQKASYPKMVKSALKGKTGLTRAEVNKTIRGVAKDYREQYGSTPRKRYLNAVHTAASTMPKATETVKPKAAAKPKAALKRKTKIEVIAEHRVKYGVAPKPKTEAQKYLEEQGKKNVQRILRRNERIRKRTEAAIANHKAEQVSKKKKDMVLTPKVYYFVNTGCTFKAAGKGSWDVYARVYKVIFSNHYYIQGARDFVDGEGLKNRPYYVCDTEDGIVYSNSRAYGFNPNSYFEKQLADFVKEAKSNYKNAHKQEIVDIKDNAITESSTTYFREIHYAEKSAKKYLAKFKGLKSYRTHYEEYLIPNSAWEEMFNHIRS